MTRLVLALLLLAQGPYGPQPVQTPLTTLPRYGVYYVTERGCIQLPLATVQTHKEGRFMLLIEAIDPSCDWTGRFWVLEAQTVPVGWRTLR